MDTIFTENWEQRLEMQFLKMKNDRCRKRAYICSPLSAEEDTEYLRNMHAARAYMLYAYEKMGVYARAPHAYLSMILCDKLPSERALALNFGLSLLENSEIILICGNRLSSGMKGEIAHAALFQMPMIVFDEGMYHEVQKEITRQGGNKRCVQLDRENFVLGFASPVSYLENAAVFK
mgnify:CR=1 FL=1